ncbi:hypothetical protein N8H10_17700 [Curtobacterium flaccumfaciens pv. poinsettiae]|nr:hypothetical protein [Curtobacterium flaccumfaciens pv. poinsettiae]
MALIIEAFPESRQHLIHAFKGIDHDHALAHAAHALMLTDLMRCALLTWGFEFHPQGAPWAAWRYGPAHRGGHPISPCGFHRPWP